MPGRSSWPSHRTSRSRRSTIRWRCSRDGCIVCRARCRMSEPLPRRRGSSALRGARSSSSAAASATRVRARPSFGSQSDTASRSPIPRPGGRSCRTGTRSTRVLLASPAPAPPMSWRQRPMSSSPSAPVSRISRPRRGRCSIRTSASSRSMSRGTTRSSTRATRSSATPWSRSTRSIGRSESGRPTRHGRQDRRPSDAGGTRTSMPCDPDQGPVGV